ncbi:MAG: ATP-binding protein [Bryobacteraceae bacterium]|jgi:heavy metal sensor kinase
MASWARVRDWAARAPQITRSLRFRLTLTYVLFFTLLLTIVGVLFHPLLRSIMYDQVDETLDEEWGAAKGYLHYFDNGWGWFFDPYDSEEQLIVLRLKNVFMLAGSDGKPTSTDQIEVADIYRSIGIDPPAEIRGRLQRLLRSKQEFETRYNQDGIPYRIRTGVLTDRLQHPYYMAICRRVDEEERTLQGITTRYLRMLPLLIGLSSIWGWFMAGRALRPVNSVAQAAERISGSNLSIRIPSRGAGDELDHLIATFNGMMDRIGVSFEKIRQFSTDVSHELRTPLTVIRGQLEVALLSAKSEEQYREAMLAALEDVERLSRIVRSLLLLSQSETGQLVLHKTKLDLAAMTHDFLEEFQVSAEEKHVRLTADLPGTCPMTGDRIQLERLISNLLSNAVKYTPEGGSVHVRLGRESGIAGTEPATVRLTVEDTGVGIPAEHLQHVFDRFYKVPSADPEKGLGLGLSFVAWIVKAHGGAIDVQSRVNEGARFTVTLPAGEA